MKRATFRVTVTEETAHPFHLALMRRPGVTRADLLMWGPMSTVSTLTWFDATPDVAEAVFEAVDSVTGIELVRGDGGTYAFVHQTAYEFPPALLELVAQSPVVYLPPIRFFEDGEVRFEAAGQTDYLAEFHESLADLVTTRIERVGELRRVGSAATLTERQREALDAAVDVGYYEVPRTGSVADVAERLDSASSTAGELLRKAEAGLVRAFASGR